LSAHYPPDACVGDAENEYHRDSGGEKENHVHVRVEGVFNLVVDGTEIDANWRQREVAGVRGLNSIQDRTRNAKEAAKPDQSHQRHFGSLQRQPRGHETRTTNLAVSAQIMKIQIQGWLKVKTK
jgi:hypothetical protein